MAYVQSLQIILWFFFNRFLYCFAGKHLLKIFTKTCFLKLQSIKNLNVRKKHLHVIPQILANKYETALLYFPPTVTARSSSCDHQGINRPMWGYNCGVQSHKDRTGIYNIKNLVVTTFFFLLWLDVITS